MSEITFIYSVFLVSFASTANGHCISSYGTQVCSYVPAPPGKTPPCALPGLTYCEHPEKKWRLNHQSLLIDESKDDFDMNSYPYPAPTYTYGPPNGVKVDSYFPDSIYTKPSLDVVKNTYIPPKNETFPAFNRQSSQPQFVKYKYLNNIPAAGHGEPYPASSYYSPLGFSSPASNPFLKIWNKKDDHWGKSSLIRKKRSDFKKLVSSISNSTKTHVRAKRQRAATSQTLCKTRSEFIMPRAALNNKGNWMYVVNMPELDNKLTQLVKSETCISQTCSGLCSLPLEYSSKCEQKYVQKRLVALEGAGNGLYNDVFWFPSCCVCTISNT